ncbi:MAG: 3-deoxy-D-manno-octulosonic acid transferase [Alphaproteobacteria bacterium]|nr:3-deoxy-D-manno-octulosonic acid transferase [Alphaproteobacteria bacterium]
MSLLWLYKNTMKAGKPLVKMVMRRRIRQGKEDPQRIGEKYAKPSLPRPLGPLMWVHVASVGEAQSMLPLIHIFLQQNPLASVLVTTITRTAAEMLKIRLPDRAFHQYMPIDRPQWVQQFLDYWHPDVILWAESELWPVMLSEIGHRRLPMALINARMSEKSFRHWQFAKKSVAELLSAFTVILTQTHKDKEFFEGLNAHSVVAAGNIKYCAPPLPYDAQQFALLQPVIAQRPCWIYASTHEGEEALAIEVHQKLRGKYPNLLTVIAPRHPQRAVDILKLCRAQNLNATLRSAAGWESEKQGSKEQDSKKQESEKQESENITPAQDHDEILIIDRMGELGLWYRLISCVCMGRSFSRDGGGGHNPLEPALLGCAVLVGPQVQNLQQIYDDMREEGVVVSLSYKDELAHRLDKFLENPDMLKNLGEKAQHYALRQSHVLDVIIEELEPVFMLARLPLLQKTNLYTPQNSVELSRESAPLQPVRTALP